MRRIITLNLFLCFSMSIVFLSSCSKNDDGDSQKTVEMTVYSETGYNITFMSDNYSEYLIVSESDNQEKRLLTSGQSIYDNLEYEKGYEYKIEARKIFLKDPPQDGSSIEFEFIKTLSKKKVIAQNNELQIEIEVGPTKVGFTTLAQNELQQGLLVKENGENRMKPLLGIEGFNYEEGYKYKLSVKKIIQAEPYFVNYILIDIISKEKV